ncbi:hypothetical protein SETIT_9G112700v2 [Setaria italica]|uniref:Uncharacterized protein n=2 Tax=Setaria TaxID=4554 RepID=A0A368SFE4_SETIT|nr:hypothetical protein SETIT_9G112700v2 [Setaria italica]TKV91659.1 hypothetical protein SEVIR_9G111200v2 [Setaria viridis]
MPSRASLAALLNDPDVASAVTGRLRGAGSGVGNDTLRHWLYDAIRANVPELQLAVLRFVPTLAGLYMCCAVSWKLLVGFEAVLLALYAHAAAQRGGTGKAETVSLLNLANPSPYHDTKVPPKAKPAELDIAVLSPPLEPHSIMRATRRACIAGAILELYQGKLSLMPISSKMDFSEFCPRLPPATDAIAVVEKWRRVPLSWELFQPVVRIVAHCLLGPSRSDELKAQVARAAECLYWRATETMDAPALLATRSLMRLSQMVEEPIPEPSFSSAIENMAELGP